MRKRFMSVALALTMALTPVAGMVPATTVMAEEANGVFAADFPEVYPQSKIEKISDKAIQDKVDALIKTMTMDEMYLMLGGSAAKSSPKGYGTGYLGGVPRLGVPVLRMYDGPKGVIGNYVLETTSPSSEVSVTSSYDEKLAYEWGKLTGADNKATAGNVQLGIQLDIIRGPFFRRSRDSMSEDNYLNSIMGYQIAKGIQDENTIVTLKHLACYSETASGRNANVTVDEQTLHEVYLAPYEYIIKNHAASAVMSSYNYINGQPAAACDYTLKEVLRDMWGFKGMVMSDWRGNYSFSTPHGMDLEMPTISYNSKDAIEEAIKNGEMTMQDVKDAVAHILYAYGEAGYLGLVEINEDGTAAADPNPPAAIELEAMENLSERAKLLDAEDEVALASAVKGSVLLKNDHNALPVSKKDKIAVIGLMGDNYLNHISESSYGRLLNMTGPYEELVNILGKDADIVYETGLDVVGTSVDADCLYTTEDCTTKGVNVSYGTNVRDEAGKVVQFVETKKATLPKIELTTGTVAGKPNRTYKNSADGIALTNGQAAEMTAYLKAPATGEYEFETLKMGGTVNITIEDTKISGSGTSSSSSGNAGIAGAHAWPSTGVVPTHTGMDVPKATTKMTLEAGKVYKVTVSCEAQATEKDLQLSLNWFKPGDKDALYSKAVEAAKTADKVIYFAWDKGETTKMQINETAQIDLLKDITKVAKGDVIVVLETGLPVEMDWEPDVDAILEMWLGGQETGKAAAQLLTGVANPSGKLSVSWPKSMNDTQYGEYATGYNADKENNLDINNGGEGIYFGYRWYDKAGIAPRYCFGYGLSYTTFAYSDLAVKKVADGYEVSFNVKNTGSVTGSEVAQVWLGAAKVPSYVQMPAKKFAAFARVEDLKPGESRKVTTKVAARELAYWDVESKDVEKWVIAEGERALYVGANHDDQALTTTIDVKDIAFEAPSVDPSEPEVTKPLTNEELTNIIKDLQNRVATLEFQAIKPAIKKTASAKKAVKVTVKAVKGAKGYQVKASTAKGFVSAKSAKSASATVTVKGLKAGKKYFVKARAYKTIAGKTVYTKWSSVKAVKAK